MNINVNVDRSDVQQLNSAINKLKTYSAVKFYQEIQRGGLNAVYKVKKDAPFRSGNLRLNVKWDGKAVRSCLILASQANGSSITTVEGFDDEVMEKVKNNFLKHNAFQCGFCSPGMLMTTKEIISSKKKLSRDEIRSEISGNYCRCTGYQSIVDAIEESINEIN